MLNSLPYKLKFSLLGATLLPLIARVVLTATGSHVTPQGYFLPVTIGGTLGFLLGLLLDKYLRSLDELKKSNTALQLEVRKRALSEARYTALFKENHSVILLVNPTSGKIVDANPSASDFYGYSLDELKGMNIDQINTLPKSEIHYNMGIAISDKKRKFSFKHRLRSGEIRDVEVHTGPIVIDDTPLLLSIIYDITELKLLQGIIPICSRCKQIRDDSGYWNKLEAYLEQHTEADFSHGICPECIEKLYPDLGHQEI